PLPDADRRRRRRYGHTDCARRGTAQRHSRLRACGHPGRGPSLEPRAVRRLQPDARAVPRPSGIVRKPMFKSIVATLLAACAIAAPAAQESLTEAARRKAFDQILDSYVRDGLVYYRALKSDRGKLDGYLNMVGSASIDKLSREERLAFWLNAYNAVVLRTVIDHYPIQNRSSDYPPRSIRQIPGAFERLPHHLAGRTVTLDQIEQTVLPEFNDPRVYLALGRGALGGGRLRSEAFSPEQVDKQLTEVANECISRTECVQIDRDAGKVN